MRGIKKHTPSNLNVYWKYQIENIYAPFTILLPLIRILNFLPLYCFVFWLEAEPFLPEAVGSSEELDEPHFQDVPPSKILKCRAEPKKMFARREKYSSDVINGTARSQHLHSRGATISYKKYVTLKTDHFHRVVERGNTPQRWLD